MTHVLLNRGDCSLADSQIERLFFVVDGVLLKCIALNPEAKSKVADAYAEPKVEGWPSLPTFRHAASARCCR